MNARPVTWAAAAAFAIGLLASTASPVRAQCTYYSIDTLATYGITLDPEVIQLQQTQSVWSAFAIRPLAGEDWDVSLYQNAAAAPACVTNPLASSTFGGSVVDFVIGDYSNDPAGTYYANCTRYSGTGFAYARWRESPQVLAPNDPGIDRSWGPNDVIETWNVPLVGGTSYTIGFGRSVSLDAKVMLFRNPGGGTYWAGRGAAELTSTTTTTYTAPTSGTYALVVVNDNGGSGGFSLQLGTCATLAALSPAATVHTDHGYDYYQFNQGSAYWSAVGVRSTVADYDISAAGGTGGSWPNCLSDLKTSSGGVGSIDFVIGDFNHNPIGTYYAMASDFTPATHGADVEWDSGADLLYVDAPAISRTADTTNVLEVWDIYLSAGQTYVFQFNPAASNLRLLLFRNNTGGVYWSGRLGAEFDVNGCQTYTAPTTGYYGVVVTHETGATASYTLGVSQAPCQCAVAINTQTPTLVGGPDEYVAFTQYVNYWGVVATRGVTNADDWDLTVSASATGTAAPSCIGPTLISSSYGAGLVDIGVIDFFYAPITTYFAHVHHYSGGAPTGLVEWDLTHGLFYHNGRVQTWNMGSNELAHAFDAFMEAGKTYTLDFNPSDPTIKLLVFENPGTSAYYVSRAAAVLTTSGPVAYTPAVSGYHALVVVNDAAVNGSYSLRYGSCTTSPVADGVPVVASEALNSYSFVQHASAWAAVGVRSGSMDWDIRVSGSQASPFPNCVGASLGGSSSGAYHYVDFVTGDFFHNAPGTYYVEANQFTNAPVEASPLEWSAGSGEILVNDVTANPYKLISEQETVQSWSVHLIAGVQYSIFFNDLFDNNNLHLLLFRNPGGGTYWTGRSGALMDMTQSFSAYVYTPPSTGEYGLIVAKDDDAKDWYSLYVRACFAPTPLASGVVATDSLAGFNSFTQTDPAWTAVGVRANSGDWEIEVNSSPSGGPPGTCQSGYLASSVRTPPTVDFVVGDFNPGGNLPGTYYARPFRLPGASTVAAVEWDSGANTITVGSQPIHRGTDASDVLEIWDVFLTAGQTYGVFFSHGGAADVKVMIFRNPGGTYWAPRDSAVYQKSGHGNYTAPATGWYGVVVVNDNGGSGYYDLAFYQSALAVQPDQTPRATALRVIQPNPARSRMSIEYSLSQQAPVRLQMIDLAGRVVAEVENQTRGAGVWHAGWNGLTRSGAKAAPGIYLVRLEVDGRLIGQRKVTLLE